MYTYSEPYYHYGEPMLIQWTMIVFLGLEYTYSKINTANLRVVLNDGDTTGSPSLYSRMYCV